MSLTRPTLLSQVAFDATQQQNFTFTVSGTSAQIVANQLTIRNQETNDIVYQEKQETFNFVHTVNAGELTNGTYYNATVSVFDAQDNQSPESIPIQFWCYSTPSVIFTNIPVDNIITNLIKTITGRIANNGQTTNIAIQEFKPNLPNVKNGEDFANYLKNNFWRDTMQFVSS